MASTMTPMTAAALSSVPVAKRRRLRHAEHVPTGGGALGIAVMGRSSHLLPSRSSRPAAPGWTRSSPACTALYVAAAIAFVGALVAAVTVRSHAGPRPAAAGPLAETP